MTTNQLSEIAIVAAPLPILSTDQANILNQLVVGAQDKHIARNLNLSLEKVKTEEKKLRNVLYARSRCHLVAIAIRYGLIENPNPHPEPLPPGAKKAPYAFYVLPRNTLDRMPRPERIVAVVSVRPQLWSIRKGTLAWSTGGIWDTVPDSFTPEWLATHSWGLTQVFDVARDIVREQEATIRRRTL